MATASGDRVGTWPWPEPNDDGAADHLSAGMALPRDVLDATDGPPVCLADLSSPAVVFVYPYMGAPSRPDPEGWDYIPGAHGSSAQASGFAVEYTGYQRAGYEVFGLSSQPIEEQTEAAMLLELPFQLINDEDGLWAGALRLPTFQAGRRQFLKRMTIIIRGGRIEGVTYPVHPPDTHASELLRTLR